jgi:uncharacterized Tic20 family protein
MSENTPPQPAPPSGQPQGGSNPNTMATIAHATVFTGFLIPLIIWLVGKDQSSFTDTEGKKALNFGILVTIAYIIAGVIGVFPFIGLIGTLLWAVTLIAALIFGIQGAAAANSGRGYTYPITFEFVK